jgi:hypothetical protein
MADQLDEKAPNIESLRASMVSAKMATTQQTVNDGPVQLAFSKLIQLGEWNNRNIRRACEIGRVDMVGGLCY